MMKSGRVHGLLLRLVSVSIVFLGFAQSAPAGIIDTTYLLDTDARAASLNRIEVLLAREDVGKQLAALGVDPALVVERLNGLSDAELLELEAQMDSKIAGGDALAIIGAVFLVLLILELVGVTDIFSRI